MDVNNFSVGVASLALSPDGRTIAAARGDSSVHLWDFASGKPLFSPDENHETAVSSVAISTDGLAVATGDGNGTIQLWDAVRGDRIRRFDLGEKGRVWALGFAPDGQTLGAAGEYSSSTSHGFRGIARLWDLPQGALRREFRLDSRAVQLAFSTNGRRVGIATCVHPEPKIQPLAGCRKKST